MGCGGEAAADEAILDFDTRAHYIKRKTSHSIRGFGCARMKRMGGTTVRQLRLILSLGFIVALTAFLFSFLHLPGPWHVFPLSLVPLRWHTAFNVDLIQALIISLATYLVVRWNILNPIRRATEWMRGLRLNGGDEASPETEGLFGPLAREVTHLARSLREARAAAGEEARLRQARESLWTAERPKAKFKASSPSLTT